MSYTSRSAQYQADHIARVVTTLHAPGSPDMDFGTSPYPTGRCIERDFPEIASSARLEQNSSVIRHNNELFQEPNFYQTDQHVFSVFTYSFIEGQAAQCITGTPFYCIETQSLPGNILVKNLLWGKHLFVKISLLLLPVLFPIVREFGYCCQCLLVYTDFSKHTSWMEDFSGIYFPPV